MYNVPNRRYTHPKRIMEKRISGAVTVIDEASDVRSNP
jgi:hypothetical protein